MELARDGPRLSPEEVLPHEWLVGLELVPGERAQPLGEGAHVVEPQVGLDPVEPAQGKGDLGQVGVAGPFAHPVDGALDPVRAGSHRGDRRRGREAEVVVAVEVDRLVRAKPAACAADELGDRFGRCDSERVDDHDLVRARLDRRLVHGLEVRRVCARPVDAEERNPDPLLDRERDRVHDPLQHRLAVDSERLELEVRDRGFDHARADAQLDQRLHVGVDGAGEAPDLGFQTGVADQLDGAPVVRGHAREPGLDPLDPELVEPARQLELFLRRQHDPDGLLPVAEGRGVEPDAPVEAVRVVDRAGPEGHRKPPPSSSQ